MNGENDKCYPPDPKYRAPSRPVLEQRIEGLRRDVSRLYKWVVGLAGSNVSLIVTIILRTWFS